MRFRIEAQSFYLNFFCVIFYNYFHLFSEPVYRHCRSGDFSFTLVFDMFLIGKFPIFWSQTICKTILFYKIFDRILHISSALLVSGKSFLYLIYVN